MTKQNIHLLEPLVANQIAAGEVIERPSSIIKECIENSLDANAQNICVDVTKAGMDKIKITDDGDGILKEDLPRALMRHATSKIKQSKDLASIASLGFRGEALSSIASVSYCRVMSKPQAQPHAFEVVSTPLAEPEVFPCAHENGTSIEVRELFYNVPARRRFLKSVKTEFGHIETMLAKLALSHPEVSFTLIHNDKLVKRYRVKAALPIENRVKEVCGPRFFEHAKHIDANIVGCHLSGWIGVPPFASRQSDCQYFFVNGRPIRDRLVTQAIRTAYKETLMSGMYACYALFLTLPLDEVDVNVHPTKHEVRFVEARLIFDFIQQSIQSSLHAPAFTETPTWNQRPKSNESVSKFSSSALPKAQYARQIHCKSEPVFKKPSQPVSVFESEIACTSSYALMEKAGQYSVINLNEAKSGMLRLYFTQNNGSIATKPLMFPEKFMLDANVLKIATDQIPLLNQYGFACQISGKQFCVSRMPQVYTGKLEQTSILALAEFEDIESWLNAYSQDFDLGLLPTEDFNALLKAYSQMQNHVGVDVVDE